MSLYNYRDQVRRCCTLGDGDLQKDIVLGNCAYDDNMVREIPAGRFRPDATRSGHFPLAEAPEGDSPDDESARGLSESEDSQDE